ncbi:MAG: sensor histidine kinase [Desulfobacterales bacterium]
MNEVGEWPGSVRHGDFPYYRKLWNRVVFTLLAAAFLPLLCIGGGMYFYAAQVTKDQLLDRLRTDIRYHRNAIDGFLRERTGDLRLVVEQVEMNDLLRPGALEKLFDNLHREVTCFRDLGVIDSEGRHRAYVGPYTLDSVNYRGTEWFQAVMARGVFISDVFMGFRKEPHFVIAVKGRGAEGLTWILRATVDAEFFDNLVSEIARGPGADAYLVNRAGDFQSRPKGGGQPMSSASLGESTPFAEMRMTQIDGAFRFTAWLNAVPWMLVAQIDREAVLKPLIRMRNVGVLIFSLGAVLIVGSVVVTTNNLVSRLEVKQRGLKALDRQLRSANRICTAMEVVDGVMKSLKDSMMNVDSTAVLLCEKDLVDSGDELKRLSGQIREQVNRSRATVDRFLHFITPTPPVVRAVRLHVIIDELLDMLSRDLFSRGILLKRNDDSDLPEIRTDPAILRQILLNLITNAVRAVNRNGTISLAAVSDGDGIRLVVSDTGPGIAESHLDRIFDPLFSTKSDGPGLGLTICQDLLRRIGGRISVSNAAGSGAVFTVRLPLRITEVVSE